jgi:hypothetical protein
MQNEPQRIGSPEDNGKANEALRRYFEISLSIVEELQHADDPLTGSESIPTMNERSNVPLTT